MIENPEWKKITDANGVLLYEGDTLFGKPYGTGRSFFLNGNVYQEGDFAIKGLVKGKEYYPSGKLRFEGTLKICYGYGPNYPVEGKCYDEDGKLYYEGKIRCDFSGMGYPQVVEPKEYGTIGQEARPDVPCFMWAEDERLAAMESEERNSEP